MAAKNHFSLPVYFPGESLDLHQGDTIRSHIAGTKIFSKKRDPNRSRWIMVSIFADTAAIQTFTTPDQPFAVPAFEMNWTPLEFVIATYLSHNWSLALPT